jgi:hypothetical protein
MGPGSRSDTLDDHCGFGNWRKRTLYRRCSHFQFCLIANSLLAKQFYLWAKENTTGRIEAVQAFKALDEGIDDATRSVWRAQMEDWEEDPDGRSNPYESKFKRTYVLFISLSPFAYICFSEKL